MPGQAGCISHRQATVEGSWINRRSTMMMLRSWWCGGAALLVCLSMTKHAEAVCSLSLIRNALTERSNELTFPEGERLLSTCFPGFVAEGLRTSFMRTCTGGQFLPALQCNEVFCTGLPAVEGATVVALSGTQVENNMYPALTTVLVLCRSGLSTENRRRRYVSECALSSAWNDTSPCSVNLNPDTTVFTRYQVQLVQSGVQFTNALSNPASSQAQSLADSLDRALFPVFEAEFGPSYVGSEDYAFSESAGGVMLDFTMLFLPSSTLDVDMFRLGFVSAFDRVNYQTTDPNMGTTYTFERDGIDISLQQVSQFTREAVIGLSIAGAVVALMLLALIVMCCRWRSENNPTSRFNIKPAPGLDGFKGGLLSAPYTAHPPPAIMSPYAQISDVPPRGLPRIL